MKQFNARIIQLLLLIIIQFLLLFSVGFAADNKEKITVNLENSEDVLKIYLDSFTKSGIPTPKAVNAAVQKAESIGIIPAWEEVVTIANAYANIIDVLSAHYTTLYYNSRSGGSGNYSYISKAADYERERNRYLNIRNKAYLELSKRYLSKGDKTKALSYAISAVKLSGVEPNTEGEDLIKKIVGYDEP